MFKQLIPPLLTPLQNTSSESPFAGRVPSKSGFARSDAKNVAQTPLVLFSATGEKAIYVLSALSLIPICRQVLPPTDRKVLVPVPLMIPPTAPTAASIASPLYFYKGTFVKSFHFAPLKSPFAA